MEEINIEMCRSFLPRRTLVVFKWYTHTIIHSIRTRRTPKHFNKPTTIDGLTNGFYHHFVRGNSLFTVDECSEICVRTIVFHMWIIYRSFYNLSMVNLVFLCYVIQIIPILIRIHQLIFYSDGTTVKWQWRGLITRYNPLQLRLGQLIPIPFSTCLGHIKTLR